MREKINSLLDNVENLPSYYAGGTLCIDIDEGVLFLNLIGTYTVSGTNEKDYLTGEQTEKLFAIYKKHKGVTEYYTKRLAKFHQKVV